MRKEMRAAVIRVGVMPFAALLFLSGGVQATAQTTTSVPTTVIINDPCLNPAAPSCPSTSAGVAPIVGNRRLALTGSSTRALLALGLASSLAGVMLVVLIARRPRPT